MTRPTHEEGIAKAQEIAERHGIAFNELRWFAADHLSQDWPEEEGMGSSDVSCHLGSLGNYDAHLLEEHAARIAARDDLVRRVAESSGKTEEESLQALRLLFAPAE